MEPLPEHVSKLKRKFDHMSLDSENENLDKQFKNSKVNDDPEVGKDRITLSFNAFQSHLKSLSPSENKFMNNINSKGPRQVSDGPKIEHNHSAENYNPNPFMQPLPRQNNSHMSTGLSNNPQFKQAGLANTSNNSINQANPYFGIHYEYNQIHNTSFHTATLLKVPFGEGQQAFQQRRVTKKITLSKEDEIEPRIVKENEPILIKTASEKPLYIDDALLQRFMDMFEE